MNSKNIRIYLLKEIVYVNIKFIILTKTLSWVYYENHKVDPHAYSGKKFICSLQINTHGVCAVIYVYARSGKQYESPYTHILS